jgi:hypothetical protein
MITMVKISLQARDSIERLFREPFTPQWMIRNQQIALHIRLEKSDKIHKKIDDKYRQAAAYSRLRIASRCSGCWYANPNVGMSG